jgi:uncharacterized protein YdaU (DUF1376 family)
MSKTPFMPLWVSDFLGDTLDLDAAEVGAYMLLLMAQWNRGGNSLPDDYKKLQRIARCGRNWPRIWEQIEHYFDRDEDGVYSKRLRLEAQNVAAKRAVNAQNGARGGSAKSLKSKEQQQANATNSLQRNSSIPEPEPYSIKDTNVSLSVSTDATRHANEVSQAVSRYNEAATKAGWPQVHKLTPNRSKQLRLRLKDCGGLNGWEDALRRAFASDFCRGRTSKPWTGFGFDWLVKAGNFTKLMEGNYDNRTDNGATSNRPENRPDPALEQIARLARLR